MNSNNWLRWQEVFEKIGIRHTACDWWSNQLQLAKDKTLEIEEKLLKVTEDLLLIKTIQIQKHFRDILNKSIVFRCAFVKVNCVKVSRIATVKVGYHRSYLGNLPIRSEIFKISMVHMLRQSIMLYRKNHFIIWKSGYINLSICRAGQNQRFAEQVSFSLLFKTLYSEIRWACLNFSFLMI